MAAQYAYVMKGMTKTFPGAQKPVLNDINLQFYHGAKIGIVGPNGAGKSTLMKIMAGLDTDFSGEAWPGENITVGYLAQEPQLDPTKTVLENVKDGAREVADMVDRFNAISAEMGDPKDDTDFDALMAEMGELQEKIDAVDGWTLDNQLEIAMEALRCPPSRLVGREPVGRREAPRRADPAADPEAVDPAARRADQPPRRRKRPVARKPSRGICRRGPDDHPRPLLPRQCRRMDPRARSRKVLPVRRQLLDLSGKEGQAPRAGRSRGERPAEGDHRTSSSGSGRAPRPARPSPRRVSPSSTNWSTRRRSAVPGKAQILIQMPERLGGKVIEVERPHQGLWRQIAVRRSDLHPAARAASSASSAPTAPASRPCSS